MANHESTSRCLTIDKKKRKKTKRNNQNNVNKFKILVDKIAVSDFDTILFVVIVDGKDT